MPCWEGKKYTLTESENFDEYMKEIGVGLVTRKLGNATSPVVELIKNGDQYTLNTTSKLKNSTMTFKVGVEFDEETLDGRKVKSVCTFTNENCLVQEQKGDKPSKIIREFTDTDLVATLTVNNVKCVRKYKAA